MSKFANIGYVLLVAASIAVADQPSPYAGQHHRDIKALSPQEVQNYLQGKGMGYAKAAELNHYPGPMHALELADQLGLGADQIESIRRLMHEHKAEARAIGAKLVESERTLEMVFRRADAEQRSLSEAVRHAASLQGQYRLSHLETHRRMRTLLTDEQVAKYDALRGYAKDSGDTYRRAH